MILKKNPFQKFIDDKRLTVRAFGREKGLPIPSLYPIYNGLRKPGRALALKLLDATDGVVTLERWGHKP